MNRIVRSVEPGNRNFANMTFANYWRMSWGCIGESNVDPRQLANVRGVYWRKSCGLSPIGECPEVSWRKSPRAMHQYRWMTLNPLSVSQSLLCVRLPDESTGKSGRELKTTHKIVTKFQNPWLELLTINWTFSNWRMSGVVLANVHMTFAIGESPVGESHIGEDPVSLF